MSEVRPIDANALILQLKEGFDDSDVYTDKDQFIIDCIHLLENAPTVEDEIKWHNLKENPNDKPTKVGWYCCKISSSDDLKMVFGQSEVMSGMYDAWLLVSCPY